MNCDHVFEYLTQPGLATEHEHAVAAHLKLCSDCSELAFAIQPAAQMLRDSANDPFAASRPTEIEPASAAGRAFPLRRVAAACSLSLADRIEQIVAGSILAAAVCVLFWAVGARHTDSSADFRWENSPPLSAFAAQPPHAVAAFVAWELPDPCYRRAQLPATSETRSGSGPTSKDELLYACCTYCHHADAARPSAALAATIAACRLCHAPF